MKTNDFDSTLTQSELDADSFLDWSDETLGRLVRHAIETLKNYKGGEYNGVYQLAAGYILVEMARKTNAEKMTLTLTEHTVKGVSTGDWRIVAKQIKKP